MMRVKADHTALDTIILSMRFNQSLQLILSTKAILSRLRFRATRGAILPWRHTARIQGGSVLDFKYSASSHKQSSFPLKAWSACPRIQSYKDSTMLLECLAVKRVIAIY